jgi:hypothetical protein
MEASVTRTGIAVLADKCFIRIMFMVRIKSRDYFKFRYLYVFVFANV